MAAVFKGVSAEKRQVGGYIQPKGVQVVDEKPPKGMAKEGFGGGGKTWQEQVFGENHKFASQTSKSDSTLH